METAHNDYLFSDNQQLIDTKAIHHFLSTQSYWANNIPLTTVQTSIKNSLCFGVYKEGKQIAFARWVTDKATFGWLADVYVENEHRGLGLSKKLMEFMLSHPDLQDLRTYQLGTLDAHGLYKQFGFKPLENPERQLAIKNTNMYPKQP